MLIKIPDKLCSVSCSYIDHPIEHFSEEFTRILTPFAVEEQVTLDQLIVILFGSQYDDLAYVFCPVIGLVILFAI